jgi:hypothetical protein
MRMFEEADQHEYTQCKQQVIQIDLFGVKSISRNDVVG